MTVRQTGATELTHRTIAANGTEHHVVTAGEGPPVLLIHGFPQTWYEWRHVIEALAPRYFCIAPDMRGMGDSAPCVVGQDKRNLANDMAGVLTALDVDRAFIVGHDWGAGVAQRFVLDHTERARALISMGMPYVPLFPLESLLTVEQLHHSWYLWMHQDPVLPEQIADRAGDALVRWFLEHGSGERGSPFTDEEVEEYASRFKGERATAQFNCYRTVFTVDAPHWAADADRRLDLPTLWIKGGQDRFNADWQQYVPLAFAHLRIEVFEGCGHWIPEEEPERLAKLMLEFLDAQIARDLDPQSEQR
ncbi:MAG TPA: alpha/beta hydrolase [Conexibacter sp.]|nr:alpha/beta hydrolase [Conexibacter sp.]